MPVSTDVRLPKFQTPVFPDRCVSCGQDQPGSVISVSTHAVGWWTVIFWMSGSRVSVDVPACPDCQRQMLRQKRLRRAVDLLATVVGVGVAVYLIGGWGGPFRKWIALAIALPFIAPVILWEMFVPPAIDLTAYSESVEYEFRDLAFAEEFAVLNGVSLEE